MDLQTKTIFLKESEKDIFAALHEQGIETKAFSEKFQYLFNKVYNNEVGYYSFIQDNVIYKFIVLPKSISINDGEKEKSFVNYLLHYYRINNKYAYDKTKKIPNSVLSLAFESNNQTEQVHDPIALFEFHKTKAILKNIEIFFQKHKHHKRVEQDYISQALKHKLNLTKNIKEMNKSKIHQSKRVDVMYSQIATVSYYVLKIYTQKRLNHTDMHNAKTLKQYVTKINTLIARKYGIDKGYTLSLPKLYGHKVTKVFQKKDEYKMLLANLRSLFGYEQLYKDSQSLASVRHDLYTSSFFINPSNFYEWYVYDILKKYADANDKTIAFDKREGTATKYKLNEELKSSNPDYILTDEKSGIKIVIDAKWKMVNEFGDIKPSDYLKLKFDTFLMEKRGYGAVPYLVYPNITIEEKKFNMVLDESSIFKFNTLEIDMEFKKHGNSLAFDFDIQKLQKTIEEESQIEEHKSMAETLSNELETQRTSILSQLVDEEENDKKDELKAELDCELQRLGLKLSETLEEQELLPEIAEILEEYNDILEEESKKFLRSSSSIYSYYKDKQYEHFDYSMPGSGFWKLIELELNTSFVWNIRILNNVCTSDCPWTPIGRSRRSVLYEINPRKKVKLNQYEQNSETRLQGIMLGGIKILLDEDDILDEFNIEYRNFLEIELPLMLEKTIDLRNKHAHIKAMSLEKFEELWNLLFEKDVSCKSELHKLLIFKRNMKENINDR